MKERIIYLIISVVLLVVSSCTKEDESKSPFDNVAYIEQAKVQDYDNVVFKKTITERQRVVSAVSAYPVSQDVEVSFKVSTELAATYNARNNTNYGVLADNHYKFSDLKATIPAGKAQAQDITIDFVDLAADDMEIDATYLLPVTIESATGGISLLNGAKTIYFLVRRSSAITTAATLKDNWIEVPSFDTPEGGACINGLKALTFELIFRSSNWKYGGPLSPEVAEKLTTLMGVEQYCLLRVGDTNFNYNQIQFDGSGVGVGKFPEKSNSKLLDENIWYHVAVTYDTTTGHVCIYVNGKLQSETFVNPTSSPINLAMRALYAQDPATYPSFKAAYQFFIGRSYEDTTRQLCGDISEVRIWSVARTQEEIWRNMYDVEEPASKPELRAYWKFNEGEGNIIHDLSQYGNDAQSHVDLIWNTSIEIPQLNRE